MDDGLMVVLEVHVYSTKEFPRTGNGRESSPPLKIVCDMRVCTVSYMCWLLPSNQSCLATTVFMGKLLATGGMGDHRVDHYHYSMQSIAGTT